MPPVDADYVLGLARDIGMFETRWTDVAAWMQSSGATLTPWESEAVIAVSRAYTSAVHEFDGKDAKAPWQAVEIDRAAVDQQVRNALRGRNRNG